MNIGEKVKELRNKKGLTLKDMSEKTGLSTGFLSQFERGITTIAVENLSNIADVLKVKINYFFDDEEKELIIRSYDQPFIRELNKTIYKSLSRYPEDKMFSPELVELLPKNDHQYPDVYSHQGEEFVYILEGILTLIIEKDVFNLYPGDSAHYLSTQKHNWDNQTNKVVKFIVVHYPKDCS
ncbi:MAG: XRE family transcriptional regulator [Clostridium sp.]|jgi:transcriptional regulator with XRE-family HTH domain|uniref:helix-turn-helix domain-containing protein n=1 Tax=Clostridium sp. TaxID=1506 RepID=UPI0025C33142|nr:XRE family transcriptional regulator [Clostridium sp.]MCH3963907.1 XRE family transcriptional regulator [Clostridium sp.]MCI1716108.1 XRE family transcriptional regulator [Clostridium sp.]MCI1800652.1 XRE family transcriptional regulator [Clostridium sp.]MCI1814285.1 XRE family transcriptional regulator [Clostridium sp.]MCI1871184.1 XRE family transcriptional regulator [Clostridium sp.]